MEQEWLRAAPLPTAPLPDSCCDSAPHHLTLLAGHWGQGVPSHTHTGRMKMSREPLALAEMPQLRDPQGDVEPVHILSYPEGAWGGGKPGRTSRKESLTSSSRSTCSSSVTDPSPAGPCCKWTHSRAELCVCVCSCLGRGSDRKEGVVLAPR